MQYHLELTRKSRLSVLGRDRKFLGRDRKFLGREILDRVLGRSRVESLGVANPNLHQLANLGGKLARATLESN